MYCGVTGPRAFQRLLIGVDARKMRCELLNSCPIIQKVGYFSSNRFATRDCKTMLDSRLRLLWTRFRVCLAARCWLCTRSSSQKSPSPYRKTKCKFLPVLKHTKEKHKKKGREMRTQSAALRRKGHSQVQGSGSTKDGMLCQRALLRLTPRSHPRLLQKAPVRTNCLFHVICPAGGRAAHHG